MSRFLRYLRIAFSTTCGIACVLLIVLWGRARETSTEGLYKVAIEYRDENVARGSLNTAFNLLMAAVHDRPFDVKAEVEKLREVVHEVSLGPSTAAIVDAAKTRGIPYFRLNTDSLVQIGYGSKQRRIIAAETDRTSAVAESIAHRQLEVPKP